MSKNFTMELAGRNLTIETESWHSWRMVCACKIRRYCCPSTATASASPREGIDFFPSVLIMRRSFTLLGNPRRFIKREGNLLKKQY